MFVERLASRRCQSIPSHRLAINKRTSKRNVAVIFEATQLSAEIAVGELELLLETREADLTVAREQDADRQSNAVFQRRVEVVERFQAVLLCALQLGDAGQSQRGRDDQSGGCPDIRQLQHRQRDVASE